MTREKGVACLIFNFRRGTVGFFVFPTFRVAERTAAVDDDDDAAVDDDDDDDDGSKADAKR